MCSSLPFLVVVLGTLVSSHLACGFCMRKEEALFSRLPFARCGLSLYPSPRVAFVSRGIVYAIQHDQDNEDRKELPPHGVAKNGWQADEEEEETYSISWTPEQEITTESNNSTILGVASTNVTDLYQELVHCEESIQTFLEGLKEETTHRDRNSLDHKLRVGALLRKKVTSVIVLNTELVKSSAEALKLNKEFSKTFKMSLLRNYIDELRLYFKMIDRITASVDRHRIVALTMLLEALKDTLAPTEDDDYHTATAVDEELAHSDEVMGDFSEEDHVISGAKGLIAFAIMKVGIRYAETMITG